LLAYPGEIRESQLENLVDRQLCKSSGADGVAGGEHVDEVAVKLGQGANPDPVGIAGDWFCAVGSVVPIRRVEWCPVIDPICEQGPEFSIGRWNQILI
jgi:hypothetical protein